jgi:ABC-2 type transport system ATP-binding protein
MAPFVADGVGVLEVRGLSKRFDEVVALDGCDFAVRPGRLTGFLGPNGAGKTTTMRSIFGLVLPDAGEVWWDGAPVSREVRRRFGYMPEARGLYPKMAVHDQVVHFGFIAGMDRAEAARAADRWLERLGLADRREAAVDELSHGNQQRAQLAVTLVHDPELLVLDEPFSGLDPLAVDDLGTMLGELAASGRTVLFSSHQLDLVEDLCQDVVTIDRGRVVLAGELQQLRAEAKRWHLTVEVVGATDDWFRDVPGVELVERSDGRVELTADRALDLGSIVAQAEAAGEIRRLDYDPPTLSQLFKEAVRR